MSMNMFFNGAFVKKFSIYESKMGETSHFEKSDEKNANLKKRDEKLNLSISNMTYSYFVRIAQSRPRRSQQLGQP